MAEEEEEGEFEWTPPPKLSLACLAGDFDEVKRLVEEEKVDIDEVDVSGKTALMVACKEHRITIALYLLAKGADIHKETNEFRFTAFHWACGNAKDDYRAVAEMIKMGVDINKPEGNGFTPLLKAVMSGDIPTTKLLIQKGADKSASVPNPTFNEVLTAQNLAKRIDHRKRDVMSKLVALDAPMPYPAAPQPTPAA